MHNDKLEIIFEDDNLVAINKPSGLLVHRTYLDPGETRFAIQMLRNQIGSWVYPIHRLDKGTSGVLLFGKSPEAASVMGSLVLKHELKKEYIAIVRGYPPDVCRINYPVPQGKMKERKPAVTGFRTIARTELEREVGIFKTARYSLLGVIPESGRRHQIRRHLKHIYYPIIGDRRYGDRAHNKFYKEELGLPDMFLHALKLEFINPYDGEVYCFKAKLPGHWIKAIEFFPKMKGAVPFE